MVSCKNYTGVKKTLINSERHVGLFMVDVSRYIQVFLRCKYNLYISGVYKILQFV